MSEEDRYWFAEQRTKRTSYGILTGFFEELLPVFGGAGFEVFNATPGSHLKVFPAVDLGNSTDGMYR